MNAIYSSDLTRNPISASSASLLCGSYRRHWVGISGLVTQRPASQPRLRTRLRPAVILAPRRIIRLAREPAPAPAAPPANVPVEDLHHAARPQGVAQLVVPGAGVQDGGGGAFALEPGVVDVLLDLEADLLHDVHFNLVTPGDAPGAAVLDGVLGARGAGACAGAVDGVVFHGGPG